MAEVVLETADITVDPVVAVEVGRGVVDVAEPAGRGERGMTTAEYAVGIVAACALAGVLVLVFREPAFVKLMGELVTNILKAFIKP